MSRLKNLYKDLVDNHKHQWQRWRDSCKEFCDEVEEVRRRIQNCQGLNKNDEEFLDRLLRKQSNGIANSGQSVLSKDNFQAFISNNDFLSALSEFIVCPTKKSFEDFQEAWEKQGKKQGAKRTPLLVNRVAAACTRDVSTTADASKFEQVFNWLIREDIISSYPADQDQSWFAKNQFLLSKFKEEFQDELRNEKTDKFYLSMFVWGLYENLSNPFKLNKQVVKYGPPGTGKTYLARQQTKSYFTNWKDEFAPENDNYKIETQREVVQFHPSFGYEDFMEGLRPILHNGKAQLTLQNGVFKEFCRRAGKWEIDVHKLGIDTNWEEITIGALKQYEHKLPDSHWEHIFQFQDRSRRVAEAVPPFFFIIDEINRAELSRVFGELMYCLEYRGVKGCIKTQYANLNDLKTGMFREKGCDESQGYKFFIPSNVYLIGTMNTIDRSVESFDLALRRRFRWEEITPDYTLLKYHLNLNEHHKKWAELADNLKNLNVQIGNEALLGSDYQIGHAYLMNLKYPTSLSIAEIRKQIWDDRIRPLLQEYLRGTGRSEVLIETFRKAFWSIEI